MRSRYHYLLDFTYFVLKLINYVTVKYSVFAYQFLIDSIPPPQFAFDCDSYAKLINVVLCFPLKPACFNKILLDVMHILAQCKSKCLLLPCK